jgi:CheY-like chemotaxis protein
LSVSDDGKGMESAVVARIFEPFFTTKGVGQGTGLGLSTVYGVVHQHEGWIEVASTPDLGTTFEVFFPALELVAGTEPEFLPRGVAAAVPSGHGETVLLVEDEPFLRETAALVATRAGYHVTQAADGPSALQAWAEASRPFDLLLTDMMMPNGLTGIQLAAQLRAQHRNLRVIFSTGYNDELLRSGATAIEGTHLLLKPYASAELLEMLHQALRSAGRRGTMSPFSSSALVPLAAG